MARQKGPLKVKGSLGDLTFYKSQDGYLVREKGGVDKQKIKNGASFARTRENGSEFGRAARAGKLLRSSIRLLTLNSDNRLVSRLHQQLMLVLQSDLTSARGLRKVSSGDLTLLTGFEFNQRSPLSATFMAPMSTTVNRTSGNLTVAIAAFVPADLIAAPSGATHYKIISGAAELNFEQRTIVSDVEESAILPWNSIGSAPLSHSLQVTAASTDPIFLVVCLLFYQEINGEKYMLNNGTYNSSAVVKVDQV